MRLEAKKYPLDIQAAAGLIGAFTAGKDLNSYTSDAMLRSAVERQFEIFGEALRRPVVDSRLVWGVVEGKLPELAAQVEEQLSRP